MPTTISSSKSELHRIQEALGGFLLLHLLKLELIKIGCPQ